MKLMMRIAYKPSRTLLFVQLAAVLLCRCRSCSLLLPLLFLLLPLLILLPLLSSLLPLLSSSCPPSQVRLMVI